MPCSGFNGGTIEFDAATDSEFGAGAGDWAFPSPIVCSSSDETAAAVTRHEHGSDDHRRSQSSSSKNSLDIAASASVPAAAGDHNNHQNVLMCIPHLEDDRRFNSNVSEIRDSSEFSKSHDEDIMTSYSKMDVDDLSPCNGNVNDSCNVNDKNRKEDELKSMETKVNATDADQVVVTDDVTVPVKEEEEEEVEDEEEDELFFQPPRRISMLWNSKLRWKEERKKVLKISIGKLRRIEDPELSLCRAILINNTVKRLHREIRDEKMARYPDVIRPVPMVTAYHLANCNNASIPEAFPRKRSCSTSTSSTHNSTNHVYEYTLDTYCSNDKENRNCSVDSSSSTVVIDYMSIDNYVDSPTAPIPAKRARLSNAKSDANNSCYSTTSPNGETSALMVDVSDFRNNDLRTATSSPLTCHQQYQTAASAFTASSCAQSLNSSVNNGQLLELNEGVAKNTALVKHEPSTQHGNHLMSLECCTKDEISHFNSRFTNLTTTTSTSTVTTSTSTTNNSCLTSPPSPKDKRDLMAAEYEKQYSQYSCGQFSIFGELQSVVFHSLITSLES